MNWPLMQDSITEEDRSAMVSFIMKTEKFTNGPEVIKFEQAWNEWLGSEYSLFVSSGSTANFLLMAAVKEKYNLKAGDKVLLPACTWMTNVAPVIQLGLQPIFCDINLEDFSFDKDQMREIATLHPDIKLIFVTHLLGFAADNEAYRAILPNAIILDDVCESHGVISKEGFKVGSNSLGATFSFYFGHHMTTIEGGMVSTNDSELYDLMKMKRSHGLARESINFNYYAKQYPAIDKSFLFITDGYNFRNHEVCAVLGSSQLKRLDKNIKIRKDNYLEFHKMLSKYEEFFYIPELQAGNSSFCLPIVSKDIDIYEALVKKMALNRIEYRPIVGGNLLGQPFLREYDMALDNTEHNVEIIERSGLYLGNSQFVNSKNINMLDKIISEVINERRN